MAKDRLEYRIPSRQRAMLDAVVRESELNQDLLPTTLSGLVIKAVDLYLDHLKSQPPLKDVIIAQDKLYREPMSVGEAAPSSRKIVTIPQKHAPS